MELLTGKCKEDFLRIIYFTEDTSQVNENLEGEILEEASAWLSNQDERFRNSLIIEFFDSTGIFIEVFNEFGQFALSIHKGDYRNKLENEGHWETRSEATESAIKKANEIYNERGT